VNEVFRKIFFFKEKKAEKKKRKKEQKRVNKRRMGAAPSHPITLPIEPVASRFVATMLGMAIGDSVGAIVEGNTPSHCHQIIKQIRQILSQHPHFLPSSYLTTSFISAGSLECLEASCPSLQSSPLWPESKELPIDEGSCYGYDRAVIRKAFAQFNGHFPLGQITDDTQLAREIALSVIESVGPHKNVLF